MCAAESLVLIGVGGALAGLASAVLVLWLASVLVDDDEFRS